MSVQPVRSSLIVDHEVLLVLRAIADVARCRPGDVVRRLVTRYVDDFAAREAAAAARTPQRATTGRPAKVIRLADRRRPRPETGKTG
jgi:hypothetical protein